MHTQRTIIPVCRLEDIPNIGKSIAADLRGIGIQQPQQLLAQEPLALYLKLAGKMGRRHDPCVLYTLLAAQHFMKSGEKFPWWTFTGQGKKLLASYAVKHSERSRDEAPHYGNHPRG